MAKLLINDVDGLQKVIEVGEGGGYFDQSRILWDERVDGPMPSVQIGGAVREGGSLAFSAARAAEVAVAELSASVPKAVDMRQARLALLAAGLLDDVNATIAAAGQAAKIEWEFAQTVRRTHPLIASVQQSRGLTDAQVDALFVGASQL